MIDPVSRATRLYYKEFSELNIAGVLLDTLKVAFVDYLPIDQIPLY